MHERPVCFVIAPIGNEGTEKRNRSRRVFEDVIKPACRRGGYTAAHAMNVTAPGLITAEVIRQVVSEALVIADLHGANANVFYELALRHATRKPVIQLAALNESIPFNLKDTRTISFDIDDVDDRKRAVNEIVAQIRRIKETPFPLHTPVSVSGVALWTPFSENSGSGRGSAIPPTITEDPDVVEEYLRTIETARNTPDQVKVLLREVRENPLVFLLNEPDEDLEKAVFLVEGVSRGGHITGTSSLQHRDADEHELYRRTVNKALRMGVKYTKIICSNTAMSSERQDKWMKELEEKAALIKDRKINPRAFNLLHFTDPISVDVLISRDKDNKCQEMIAGFAGGQKHGGFRTKDTEMVTKWYEIYVQEKVIGPAEEHTRKVLAGEDKCPCSAFLRLLEEARSSVATRTKPIRRAKHK